MYILGKHVILAFFLAVMVDVYAETNPVVLQRRLFGLIAKYKSKKLTKNFDKFVTVCETNLGKRALLMVVLIVLRRNSEVFPHGIR